MSDVDEIAKRLVPCECRYGESETGEHDRGCPRAYVGWEDIAAALRAEREAVAEWKERALRAEAEAMTLRDFERARNTVSRQTKAEAEL